MSDFDPYYLWLGIPSHEQPPNHYRLLGVSLYEDNPEVIDAAANRQSTYLHSLATGRQRQASQTLLNEVAAARRCLLTKDAKTAYDIQLRAALSPPVAPTVIAPVAKPFAAPIASPVMVPIAKPIAMPASVVVQNAHTPLVDLFGFSEAAPVVEADTSTKMATAKPTKTAEATGAQLRRIGIIGGSLAVILATVGIYFWRTNQGDTDSRPVRSTKTNRTSKPTKSDLPKPPKPTPKNNNDSQIGATAGEKPKKNLVRYLRIELPRTGVLTLAEVEVYSGGINVAPRGFATQKNTAHGCDATKAIDGNTSGEFGKKGQTHTEETERPWWQLDLGGAYPVDRIVIFNRTDAGMGERLAGFSILATDNNRKPTLSREGQAAPVGKVEFVLNTETPASNSAQKSP